MWSPLLTILRQLWQPSMGNTMAHTVVIPMIYLTTVSCSVAKDLAYSDYVMMSSLVSPGKVAWTPMLQHSLRRTLPMWTLCAVAIQPVRPQAGWAGKHQGVPPASSKDLHPALWHVLASQCAIKRGWNLACHHVQKGLLKARPDWQTPWCSREVHHRFS